MNVMTDMGWKERGLLGAALWFLLGNQYITSAQIPGKVFEVRRGTGMGLKHSGSIADAAFYSRVERTFALSPVMQAHYLIDLYLRFKDDILVLCRSRAAAEAFLRGLRERAGYFALTMESLSAQEADFLEVRISKMPCATAASGLTWSVKPVFKKTSLGQPLATDSAHPPGCILWPLQRVKALTRLCSTDRLKEEALEALIRRFQHHFAPPCLIRAMRDVFAGRIDLAKRGARRQEQDSGTWWLVLPWYPQWDAGGVARTIADFTRDPVWNRVLAKIFGREMAPAIRISWRNGLPHSQRVLEGLSR